MSSNIEIARAVTPRDIHAIAANLGLAADDIEVYGRHKAKILRPPGAARGKLILVTAISPTPFGEGKTTMAIGLADGLRRLGAQSMLALREPSMGPVFGMKGGATGGGQAQVIPMEDINLHFTGDMHAITTANNLLSSLIDNHLKHGNELELLPARIEWKRCLDLNDRALRDIRCGLGDGNGMPRSDGFNISAASEIMAILCLASDLHDLKERLGNILVGYNISGEPVFARQLDAADALAIVLKDALKPNLVQTLEHTPALLHGGPFANIAHGCSSIIATRTALGLADYVVTEAGFGADLGAEKFFDIKCRTADLTAHAAVLVATTRSLKYNGGAERTAVHEPDIDALQRGLCNLQAHIDTLRNVFHVPVVVAINAFSHDRDDELACMAAAAEQHGAQAVIARAAQHGSEGCRDLAAAVLDTIVSQPPASGFCYPLDIPVAQKIERVAKRIYGAASITLSARAQEKLNALDALDAHAWPVCIAKTQYSFSQDPKLLGHPTGHEFHVRDIEIRAGARLLVVIAGTMLLMPGLPKRPASVGMTISDEGEIAGLF